MAVFKKEEIFESNEGFWEVNKLEDKIVGTSRWSLIHEVVFEKEGKFYKTTYSEGATEMQEEGPFEYETEIECVEVELREVTCKKWFEKGD